MSGYYARSQRAAVRSAKELARQVKEQAKLDELARAKLEVTAHEIQVQVLVSLHQDVGENWDWPRLAATLPPAPPVDMRFHELRARQSAAIAYGGEGEAGSTASQETIAAGQRRDAEVLAANKQTYDRQYRHWAKMSGLAQRILQRDLSAYTESIQEFSPLAELTELGTNMEFTVHSASLIECVLSMKDTSVIPSEIKSLTAGGKLSIKTMPRARFHELFQDYICSGVLRVARELFAMLPIEHALITAQTAILDTATGASADKPVISVGIPREAIEKITWNAVDPSDAIDRMLHRGDFKASRKTGAFLPIAPLTPREIAGQKPMAQSLENLRAQVSTLHRDIVSMLEEPSTV